MPVQESILVQAFFTLSFLFSEKHEIFKKLLLLDKNCAKIQLLVKHICGTYIRDKEGFSHERSVVGQNKKNQQAIA